MKPSQPVGGGRGLCRGSGRLSRTECFRVRNGTIRIVLLTISDEQREPRSGQKAGGSRHDCSRVDADLFLRHLSHTRRTHREDRPQVGPMDLRRCDSIATCRLGASAGVNEHEGLVRAIAQMPRDLAFEVGQPQGYHIAVAW